MRHTTLTSTIDTATAFIAIVCSIVLAHPVRADDRVVTAQGALAGLGPQASGVREFRGVPFARPPLGTLRWAAPQPMASWPGVRQATAFGPRCMQQPIFSDMVFRSNGVSEDCLYLNIWTPAKSAHEQLPVLVYFYGGGFIAGDGSELRYDGASLASAGLVVVTVNYRLGVFGFLAHPDLSRESGGHGSGNYGLLDQHAALQWVHENVRAFGGDPAHVTIAGESAGSWSVSAQMVSPLSRDLIAGAIGESGSLLGALPATTLGEGERNGERFAEAAGVASIAALRAMPADQLMELAGKLLQAEDKSGLRPFAATIDGYFLPRQPAELYAAGAQARVPLLAGVNTGEGQPDAILGQSAPTVAAYRAALHRQFKARADDCFAVYPASSDGTSVLDAAQDLASDLFIAYSTRRWVQLATRSDGPPTYYYLFARPRPALSGVTAPRGATHSAEIEYALGNLDSNRVYAWTAEDRQVSKAMRAYFVNFIKHGDPNGSGLVRWPQFSSGERLRIDVVSRAEPETSGARQQFLDRHFASRAAAMSADGER